MTREDREKAIEILRADSIASYSVEDILSARDIAIKALEQESVIDKIRAEIKQYQSDYDVHGTEYDRTAWKAFNRCLQIIDKYKAEPEDKE